MAGVRISNLPPSAAAALSDLVAAVQSGVTNKTTLQQIATLFNTELSFLPLSGGTLTGDLILNSDPLIPLQAATKQYVDAVAQGLTIQGAVRLATTVNLTATYLNGTAGIGATLTNSGPLAALVIDGVAAAANDRILVKNQTSPIQNGIYVVTNIGSGITNWVMIRATDYDQPTEIQPGDLIIVTAGSTNAQSSWLQTATIATIGISPIVFVLFTSSSAIGGFTNIFLLMGG